MSWAMIKYALNSSIGTKKFIPLDKMFQHQIIPNDDVAWYVFKGGTPLDVEEEFVKKFKIGLDGKCLISFKIEYGSTASNRFGKVVVLVNGITVYEKQNVISGYSGATFKTDEIEVEKADVIEIRFANTRDEQGVGREVSVSEACVLGSISPKAFFEEVL